MTTATVMTSADVALAVRDTLRDRLIDDWWRVPVRSSAEPPHTFEYYDALAVAEDDINDKTGLKVLLVPAFSA